MNRRVLHCWLLIAALGPVSGMASGGEWAVEKIEPSWPDKERMSCLDNGIIRLGVDLDLGGAITYLSDSRNRINLINNHDWGRQVQMSHYSGPIPFAPDGKQPKEHWRNLGWNPIQAGDCFGNRSKVVDHRNDGRTLYIKCVPMQWPLDNVPGECEFETWIHLEDNTVQVRCRITNHRPDKTQYAARMQELPAVYTNGPWYRLMTYVGDKPFTNDVLTRIENKPEPGKFPWAHWMATENWAALVDDKDWGLGVWHPGLYSFFGGFMGKPGAGGAKDSPTGYIGPAQLEILDHNIVYEYSYALILGSLEQIRRYVYARSPRPLPPHYRFEKDRQHWHYIDASDTGWPIRGELNVVLKGKRPQIIGPDEFWLAEDAPTLLLDAAFQTGQKRARVYWTRYDAPSTSQAMSLAFDLRPDNEYHVYEIPLASSPEYRGVITGLRLMPAPEAKQGAHIRIRSISFRRD